VSIPQDAKDLGSSINYITGGAYGPDLSLTNFVSGSGGAAAITNTFTYNKRLQPLTMSAATASQTLFSIGYDFHLGNGDNGNVFGITNYKDANRNQTFTYDGLNRVTSAQNAGTDCTAKVLQNKTEYWGNSYTYDAWGNLVGKIITKCGAENLSVTADTHNWIHISPNDYKYDVAGNMTYDATENANLSYDQENRITGANGYTYTYDGDGNRVRKSNGNTASSGTLYWEMTPGVMAETDLAGTIKSEYVFFDGERVARRDGATGTGGVFYYFSDHLKTASVITDSAGVIKADSDYYPWGGELQFVANDSNDYKFTGKKRDSETGLDYFGARYYSNGLGRFITPDWAAKTTAVPYAEFADPQSLNLYSYVRNIPSTRLDADGHCAGDQCSDIAVNISVTSKPEFRTNEKQPDSTYKTGVHGQLTITLTENGKPMTNVPITEKVEFKVSKNGSEPTWNPVTAKKPVPTNAAGKVKDDVYLQLPTKQPASKDLVAAVKTDQTTNAYTMQQTQTITFPGPNGATCSATDQRTLTNVVISGNMNKKSDSTGSNYTLTESPMHPVVKEQK
jgi:RHS repeat-associated protein